MEKEEDKSFHGQFVHFLTYYQAEIMIGIPIVVIAGYIIAKALNNK